MRQRTNGSTTPNPPTTIESQIAEAVATAVSLALDQRLSEITEQLDDLQRGERAERMYTRAELAEHLRCSMRTIDQLMTEGMPHVRLGGPGGSPRYLASEVIAWMRER